MKNNNMPIEFMRLCQLDRTVKFDQVCVCVVCVYFVCVYDVYEPNVADVHKKKVLSFVVLELEYSDDVENLRVIWSIF